jgi:hypothetical protein
MRIRLLSPALTSAALALFSFSAGGAQAGSFFGPCCYGADYPYQYPTRSHNQFGCGPGTNCQARHPFFKHRLFHRNQGTPNDGVAVNGMPVNGMPVNSMPVNSMPVNSMPVNGMPIETVQAPIVQSPTMTAPIHMTSEAPAPVPAMPAVQSRIAPVPAPLPAGPASTDPPAVDSSGKPPF